MRSPLQVRVVEQPLTRSQRSDRDARGLRMSQADRLRRNRPFGREAIFCGGPFGKPVVHAEHLTADCAGLTSAPTAEMTPETRAPKWRRSLFLHPWYER
jgi:hypothetical protein